MKQQLAAAAILVMLGGVALGADHAPLPEKLVAAKTAFIENKSGEPGFSDAVFAQVQDWGRWRIVTDRSQANIVLVLDHRDIFIHNFFSLNVVDAQTEGLLWTKRVDPSIRIYGRVSRKLFEDLRKRLPAK